MSNNATAYASFSDLYSRAVSRADRREEARNVEPFPRWGLVPPFEQGRIETVTTAAVLSAYRLANRHGHLWSYLSVRDVLRTSCHTWEGFASLLKDLVREQDLDPYGWGGEYPYSPTHVTGTGRTLWYVRQDGTVVVHIRRPQGIALMAELTRKGQLIKLWESEFVETEDRHYEALAYVQLCLATPTSELVRREARLPLP